MPFVPFPIKFTSGLRQDIGELVDADPSQLQELTNVVFTHDGHLRGRPGANSKDGAVQFGQDADQALTIDEWTDEALVSVPAGIVAAPYGSTTTNEDVLACWQGASIYRRDGLWVEAGQVTSFRVTPSSALSVAAGTATLFEPNPVPCGTSVVGIQTTIGPNTGFPFVNAAGEVSFRSRASQVNFDVVSRANCAAAGESLFYLNSSGEVRVQLCTSPPTATDLLLTTGADTGTNPRQSISVVSGESGSFYVAFKSATAGRITLLRVSSAGSVTATLNVSGLGSVDSLSITRDPTTTRLGLIWGEVPTTLKSKVFTTTASTITDTALDVTHTTTAVSLGGTFSGIHAGLSHNGKMSILYSTATVNISTVVTGREFLSAAATTVSNLHGSAGTGTPPGLPPFPDLVWMPIFAGQVVSGRTYIGVNRCTANSNHRAQWLVLDVTEYYTSGTFTKNVVAAGAVDGNETIRPSSVAASATSISFVVPLGTSFDPEGVSSSAITRIRLDYQPVQAVHAHGLTLLSGNVMHTFDGNKVIPHHFPEERPIILSTASAAGTLAVGSYSYQTTWEATNARGQVIRSGASNIATRAVAVTSTITIETTVPQLWRYLTPGDTVRVRLWGTVVNPTPDAAKFLITETLITASPTTAFITQTHSVAVDTAGEQLYQSVGIVPDMRAPSADRGVAFANERAWCADYRRVYASKLLRPNLAVSFNSNGAHTLEIPSALGTIQGLSGFQDQVIIVCSKGVAVIRGPGLDDLVQGPGWAVDTLNGPGSRIVTPRAVCALPEGNAYLGSDGDIWLVTPSLAVTCISRPARDSGVGADGAGGDVVFVEGANEGNSSANPLIVAGRGDYRVFDTNAAKWANWTFALNQFLYVTGIDGILWGQMTSSPWIGAVELLDIDSGFDYGQEVSARIVTNAVKPGDSVRGWGRIRSLQLHAKFNLDPVTVDVTITADGNGRELLHKNAVLVAGQELHWPDGSPEFRCTQQRAAWARVDILITPAMFDIAGIDLWVDASNDAAPANNRK